MKATTTNQNQDEQRQQGNNSKPENKDNLDSRKGEEQLSKGDDVSNNEKTTHKEQKGPVK